MANSLQMIEISLNHDSSKENNNQLEWVGVSAVTHLLF